VSSLDLDRSHHQLVRELAMKSDVLVENFKLGS